MSCDAGSDGRRWEYLDLELDLWWRSGEFGLVDEQELEDEVWLGRAALALGWLTMATST